MSCHLHRSSTLRIIRAQAPHSAVTVVARALVGALLLACAPGPAAGQYVSNSLLFNISITAAREALSAELKHHPDLLDLYYPGEYRLPTDYYVFQPPNRVTEYTQNVIFDPCRGYDHDCCSDTYGTPEFQVINTDPADIGYASRKLVDAAGTNIDVEISRRPDDELYIGVYWGL
jgi:hypothetical protein